MAFAVLVALYSWWVAGLPSFSTGTTLAALLPGAAALIAGRRLPPRPTRPVTWRLAAPWLVVATALAAVQLQAFVRHPRSEHPTLSWLAAGALEARPVRAAALVAWLAGAAWQGRP